MKKTLILRKSIPLDGKQVKEFSYDIDEITNDLFLTACAKSSIAGADMNASATMEINTALHLQLGKAAIIAVNPNIDWGDLDRIKGIDLVSLCGIGRFFTNMNSEELSEETNSEEQSEDTAETTTQV